MKYRLVNENFKDKYAENYIKSKGIEDIDSVPGNKLQEDDLSYADSIIGVATGMPISVIPIIIVIIIILIPVAFLVWKKIDERRYV